MKNLYASPAVAPIQAKVKSGKHFSYTCYSITIRDGRGIDLGVKSHSDFLTWLEKDTLYACCSIEKTGREAHFQAGAIFASPLRQDVLRQKLLDHYSSLNWDAYQMKYAVKVVPHNDPEKLFEYCLKESVPLVFKCWIPRKQFVGCLCDKKWMFCPNCDIHKHAWASSSDYDYLWKQIAKLGYHGYEQALIQMDQWRGSDLYELYRPWYPCSYP